jgi:hypothetical protein
MTSRRRLAVLSVLAIAVACNAKDKSGNKDLSDMIQKMSDSTSSSDQASATGDPCSLLDSSEVAAAIGPLASPPYRGEFAPNANSPSCRYDTKDHRRMLVNVDWSGGPQAMKIIGFGRKLTDPIAKNGEEKIGTTVLSSGDTIAGAWDQIAEGPMQCCDLHALRGDRHVELDWTGTRLSSRGAAALLDSAVKRLDHPLAINGASGVAAAKQNFAAEAKDSTLVMCDLLPQAKAEALLGRPLVKPPTRGSAAGAAGGRECTYTTVLAAPGVIPQEYDVTLWVWRDGAVDFANDQFASHMGVHAMRRQLTGDTTTPPLDTANYPVGPWDVASRSVSPGYEAVVGAHLVKVGAFDKKGALALLAGVSQALAAPH